MNLARSSRAVKVAAIFSALALSAPMVAQDGPPPARVVTSPIVMETIRVEVPLTGSVEPKRFTQISAEIEGLVQAVLVDAGDYVPEGGEMLKMRAEPTILERKEAEANKALETASLMELKNGSRQEDKVAARARAEEARATLDVEELELKRLSELYRDKVISKSEFDRQDALVKELSAQVIRYDAEAEKMRIGPRSELIDAAQARVDAEQAQIDILQDEIDRHVISAPFSGVIGQKLVEKGQWVSKGTTLFTFAELQVLWVEVDLPEAYFNRISLGDKARIEVPAAPDKVFEATVTAKIPLADSVSRTFPIRVEVDNSDFQIAPGMFARVILELQDTAKEAMLAPKDAVVMAPDRSQKVWVVRNGENGPSAFSSTVETGQAYRDMVEIFSDELKPGDQVIIRGNESIRFPGQGVNVINPPSSPDSTEATEAINS